MGETIVIHEVSMKLGWGPEDEIAKKLFIGSRPFEMQLYYDLFNDLSENLSNKVMLILELLAICPEDLQKHLLKALSISIQGLGVSMEQQLQTYKNSMRSEQGKG